MTYRPAQASSLCKSHAACRRLCHRLLGEHAKEHKRLQLVVLNGCESAALGQKCLEHGVPAVVCWATKVVDEAAYLFARGFFSALKPSNEYGADDGYKNAFNVAKTAVTANTRPVSAEDGSVANEPYFELRDPAVRVAGTSSYGAGLPVLLPRVPLPAAAEMSAAADAPPPVTTATVAPASIFQHTAAQSPGRQKELKRQRRV